MYYVTGGMPESVLMWTEARDVNAMQEALSGMTFKAFDETFGELIIDNVEKVVYS